MKRVLRFAAVNTLGLALLAAGVPLQAATHNGNDRWLGNGDAHYQYDRDNRAYRHDDGRGWADRNHGAVYAAPGVPNYYVNQYAYAPQAGYYYPDQHVGRTAAIVLGSAATGAVIGAAAGHGQGAAIGALVGGVAGAIASHAIIHHDYR